MSQATLFWDVRMRKEGEQFVFGSVFELSEQPALTKNICQA